MSLVHKFSCEICGAEKNANSHWFLAQIDATGMSISRWSESHAQDHGVFHLCGEAHAQTLLSRYLNAPDQFVHTPVRVLNAEENDLTPVQSHLISRVLQQPGELNIESEEIFDLLAATEAVLKGRITIGAENTDRFDS